jgi:hypothetical protein
MVLLLFIFFANRYYNNPRFVVLANLACTVGLGLLFMLITTSLGLLFMPITSGLGLLCMKKYLGLLFMPITTGLGLFACQIWHAQQGYCCYNLACTTRLGRLCMPNLHAQHPKACCACQFSMHHMPWVVVHANLACTTYLWLLCMPNCMHAQQP